MADETKIQWHPAFCSAVELTLWANKNSLDYTREYNLSSKPLQVDLLVIKKNDGAEIKDEFGRIFRRHNLLEYKSPGDELNIDTWYKTIAYGCLYKALTGEHVDDTKAEDITLTLVRREKPEELLSALVASGLEVSSNYPGIYHIRGNVLFETQIIATHDLPPKTHVWLKALTRSIDAAEARQVAAEAAKYPEGSKERLLADSVMQVAVSANYKTFEKLREEDPIMCDALRELMKPEMDKAVDTAVDKAVDGNKRETAERMIRKEKYSDEEIADISGLTVKQVEKLKTEKLVTA